MENDMKVIALSGYKRSGKDTAAEVLIQNGYTRVAFADVLKDMAAEEYGIPRSHFDDPAYKERPILSLPVEPKDDFTEMVTKFMLKEFRTEGGNMPLGYYIESGVLYGVMGRHIEKVYWTPRALAILKGSVNRSVKSDYWVSKAIQAASEVDGPVVITDMRYKSEMQQLRYAFGDSLMTVRVNRFDSTESQDPSERDLDSASFDVILENKGSLEEFLNKVKGLV